jgi:hypothetical protein
VTLAMASGWPPSEIRQLTLGEVAELTERLTSQAQRSAARRARRKR